MQPLLFAKSISFDAIRENMKRAEQEMQAEISQFKADITREFAFAKPVVIPPAEKHHSLEKAHESMLKNAKKAVEEHREKDPDTYATVEAIQKSTTEKQSKLSTLTYNVSQAAIQGPRKTMEDATRIVTLDNGLLVSIFDGHGGQAVAEYAAKAMDRFKEELKTAKGNVRNAFEALICKIQNEVEEQGISTWTGSTAVISYIDTITKKIYTATLGDSEANIYRRIDSKMCSIPLSCVRDWSHPKEAVRASAYMCKSTIATQWPQSSNPKALRLQYPNTRIANNVSRALGDKMFSGTKSLPGIIHKAKITENDVVDNDVVVLACDGLKDYVSEKNIATTVGACSLLESFDIAQWLVNRAKYVTKDNVSVVVVQVKEQISIQGIWKKFRASLT